MHTYHGSTTSALSRTKKLFSFIDNAPGQVNLEYSNIKLSFLPANTTSHLQPLVAGIITQTKALYKKQMLCEVLCEVKKGTPAWKAAKDIQIYDAIESLHLAWTGVEPDNIQCCFNKAGFQHVFNKPITDVPDPDLEADVTDDMQSLLDILFTEFINLESDEMIHPQAAPTISQEQAPRDDDEVPNDYQPDSDCTPNLSFLWTNI